MSSWFMLTSTLHWSPHLRRQPSPSRPFLLSVSSQQRQTLLPCDLPHWSHLCMLLASTFSFCPQPPQMSLTSSFESKRFVSKDHFNAASFLPVESWPTVPDSSHLPSCHMSGWLTQVQTFGGSTPVPGGLHVNFPSQLHSQLYFSDRTWFSPYALPRYPEALPGFFRQNRLPSVFQFSSIQSLSRVWLFVTPWIAARQASLSITNSWSLPKVMSIESLMPSSHLILCRPLLLLPPIPPSIRVFSNESTLHMSGQSVGVSASASVLPKKSQDWFPLGWTGWTSLQSKGLSGVFSNTTVQKHQFFGAQFSS